MKTLIVRLLVGITAATIFTALGAQLALPPTSFSVLSKVFLFVCGSALLWALIWFPRTKKVAEYRRDDNGNSAILQQRLNDALNAITAQVSTDFQIALMTNDLELLINLFVALPQARRVAVFKLISVAWQDDNLDVLRSFVEKDYSSLASYAPRREAARKLLAALTGDERFLTIMGLKDIQLLNLARSEQGNNVLLTTIKLLLQSRYSRSFERAVNDIVNYYIEEKHLEIAQYHQKTFLDQDRLPFIREVVLAGPYSAMVEMVEQKEFTPPIAMLSDEGSRGIATAILKMVLPYSEEDLLASVTDPLMSETLAAWLVQASKANDKQAGYREAFVHAVIKFRRQHMVVR